MVLLKDEADDKPFSQEMQEMPLLRIIGAVNAALVVLCILTSKDMPKEVFREDFIVGLVQMTKMQLLHLETDASRRTSF